MCMSVIFMDSDDNKKIYIDLVYDIIREDLQLRKGP